MQPFTERHPPTYAYLDTDLGPVWTVVWVWPERQLPGGPLTQRCPHRHRSIAAAIACARTRTGDVRTR